MPNAHPTHFKSLNGGFSIGDKFYEPGRIVPVEEISDQLDFLFGSGAIAIATTDEIEAYKKTTKQADAPQPKPTK